MKKLNELQSYLTRLRGLMLTLIILCSIGSGNVWGVTYTKITSTAGLPSDGNSAKYLIVYETLNYVYDGSKTGSDLGATGDYKTSGNTTFTRDGSTITIKGTDNFYFTISRSGNNYIIQSASGYYIGRTTNSNGINQSTTDTYNHTITFSSNNAQITSSAGPKLQFLNSSGSYTFKYYKSSQQLVQLYKVDASCEDLSTPGSLSSTTVTSGSVSPSWGSVSHASKYEVVLMNSSGTALTPTATYTIETTSTSYTFSGLEASTTYKWKVKAVGDGADYCDSEYTSNQTITTSASTTPTLTLTGSGAFGNVNVDGTKDLNFTLNGSNLTANATVSVSGTGFSLVTPSNGTLTQTAGSISGSNNITVRFSPTAATSYAGTLTVTSTGASDATVSLSGTGQLADTYVDLMHGDENDTQTLTGTYTVPTFTTAATGSTCEGTHKYFAGFSNSPNSTTIVKTAGATGQTATGATYYAVWGDGVPTTTYTRLTSIAEIDESAQYVLGIDGSGFHYSGTSSWGLMALPASQTPLYYTLTKESGATPTYFTAATTISSYTYYLQVGSTGGFAMTTSTGTSDGQLSIGSTTNFGGDDKAYAVSNKNDKSKSLRKNGTSGIRCYNNTTTGSLVFFYKVTAGGAIDYKVSCCADAAEVTLTPSSQTVYRDIDGNAATTIAFSKTGGGSGAWGTPTVDPSGPIVTKDGSNINFSATATGTYTVGIGFTETCEKTGSATVTVAEQPIITASGTTTFSTTCGTNSASSDITVNSRYLSGSTITASISKETGSGSFKISTDNSTFATTSKSITGGTTSKATSHIYVRYEPTADESGSIAGTLTLTCGGKTETVSLSGTVTCGCNIRFTSAANLVQVTAANGIWVQANSELALSGSFLKTNADNANVSIRAYTDNAHFRLKTSGTDGEGAAKTSSADALSLATNVSSNTANGWTGNIGIVYKPAAHNTTETATLTVEVYRYGGSSVYSSTTYTLYGRSLPENFVIAVTDGSGHWFAVPADMVAPWGGSCSTGLSTYTPYPIEVNNTTTPSALTSSAPSRAVYTAAERTGYVNTNPQTMSYKSVPLSDGVTTYYLYGGGTGGDANNTNTHIQNASFDTSEKEKWFLDVVNWANKEYNMHVPTSVSPNVLAFTTAGGARNVGQYAANASTTKKSIYILPVTSTCDNYIAPENITCYGIDADYYTIRFKPDRTKNYEVSLNGSSWSDITTRVINRCTDDAHPTLVEADIPMDTYKGQTVYIRVKDDASDCKPSATFAVPNPSLTVNSGSWMTMTGVAGQAFSNSDNSITISGLASCSNTVSVAVSGTDEDKITASINSSTGVVTIGMSAVNAVAGTYNATLTFTADGATTQTQNIKITIQNYAIQAIVGNPTYFSNGVLCYSADLEGDYYPLAIQNALYKDGSYITLGDFNSNSAFTFTDLNTGSTSIGGALSMALNPSNSVKVSLQNKIASMVAGHTYRLAWTNTNKVVTNSAGLPYQDCYIDFVYSLDCDAPVAMVACPVGVNSFTANWDGPCDATNSSLNVYTKSNSTILPVSELGSSYVKGLGYAGSNELNCTNGTLYYIYAKGTAQTSPTLSSDGEPLLADVDNNYWYTLFTPYLSKGGTISTETEYTITVKIYNKSSASNACGVDFEVMDNGDGLAKNCSITKKTVTIDGVSATSKRLVANSTSGSTHTFTVKGLDGTDRLMFTGYESSSIASNNYNVYLYYLKVEANSKNSVSGYPKSVTCANGKNDVTGLSANTQYYYTLTNSGNESNEIAVKTRTEHTPQMGFNPGYAVLQSDGGGAVSEEVAITDGNVGSMAKYFYSICSASDISYTITGTNASMFTVDWSGVNYYSDLGGYLDGNLVITYNPGGVEGVHTAKLTVTENGESFELPLKGITCPASFGSMATAATPVGDNSATANWSQSTTGNLMLSQNGVLNANMILNSGFETNDKTGWTDSGIAASVNCTVTSNQKKTGSYSLYMPTSNTSSSALNSTKHGGVFADAISLSPGTYVMSAYICGTSDGSSKSTLTASSVGIGLCTMSSYTPSVKYSSFGLGAANNNWQQVSATFEVTTAGTYYPFVAHKNSSNGIFIDDVSLVRTAAEPNTEGYTAYPITSATSLNLTGLQASTAYSYYIVNANGCESNVITFNTTGTLGDPELDADDVEISGSAGTTATAIAVVEATNVVSDITLTLGSCTSGLTIGATKMASTGGALPITFAIPGGATPGSSGTCTVSMITVGLSTPVTFDIHWSVSAGVDINTPIVEVTDITNESITIESNQTDADGAHIIINRELTPEEIAANLNVGDEIFFSKYYEAYSHKKLWAIFNPTDHRISLANTYVWRSSSSSSAWLTDKAFSLAGAGAIETGYIHPNEEIIVYTKDQVGSCEAGKADMSDWYAGSSSDQSLSFSGDDALLLVRKDVSGTEDNPPTSSVDGETTYTWRKYNDGVNDWWMLDMIGARTAANLPTDGACTSWSWTNCNTSTVERGDDNGWVGTNGKYLDNTTYASCSPYVLSTNRCLLIRERSVKCGNNAVATNVGDMYTLGKGGVPTEWNGAHVPQDGNQATVSCNNFAFVGGYDYAGYYNSWRELENMTIADATPNADGSFTFEDLEIPLYYCHPYRIEVTQNVTLNGVDVENILAYTDYKVPIVVDENANTTTAKFFSTPHANNPLTSTICNTCDVVIRDGAQLTHVSGGQAQFRNMTVYPAAKFSNTAKQAFELNRLYMQSLNDAVGYAIINNDGSSIVADTVIHTKRINDAYWYTFTLPYNCSVATIRQLNGKVVGKYWDGSSAYVDEDWTIQYYDGAARQAAGTSANAGQVSAFWRYVPANGTLQAGQAYIVGLFTTEWKGQHKTLYFPPTTFPGYAESGDDAKTTSVNNWTTNLSCEKRHHGWNFVGSPYISRFGESTAGQGLNNTTNLIMGKLKDDGTYDPTTTTEVYVSVPDGGNSMTYTQVRAAATTLDPFKGYFVQAKDPTGGVNETLTLTYAKGNRALSAPRRRAVSERERVIADIKVEGNGSEDIGGIVVDEQYTTDYEIGGDLTKLFAKDSKPQVYFLDQENQKLAYIALPDANAENVPMEIFAPKAGTYTISLNERSSKTASAESIELLYQGNVVANLLIESYNIEATSAKATITGYSVRIRRVAQVATSLETINGEAIQVVSTNGQISISNLPTDGLVSVFDMTGKMLVRTGASAGGLVQVAAPTGVYNIVVESAGGHATVKTIVK